MARGHTTIVANVDTHLTFSKTSKGLIKVEMGKSRLGPEVESFNLRLEGSVEEALARVTYM